MKKILSGRRWISYRIFLSMLLMVWVGLGNLPTFGQERVRKVIEVRQEAILELKDLRERRDLGFKGLRRHGLEKLILTLKRQINAYPTVHEQTRLNQVIYLIDQTILPILPMEGLEATISLRNYYQELAAVDDEDEMYIDVEDLDVD